MAAADCWSDDEVTQKHLNQFRELLAGQRADQQADRCADTQTSLYSPDQNRAATLDYSRKLYEGTDA